MIIQYRIICSRLIISMEFYRNPHHRGFFLNLIYHFLVLVLVLQPHSRAARASHLPSARPQPRDLKLTWRFPWCSCSSSPRLSPDRNWWRFCLRRRCRAWGRRSKGKPRTRRAKGYQRRTYPLVEREGSDQGGGGKVREGLLLRGYMIEKEEWRCIFLDRLFSAPFDFWNTERIVFFCMFFYCFFFCFFFCLSVCFFLLLGQLWERKGGCNRKL